MIDSIKDLSDEYLLEIQQINAHQLSIARRKPEIYGSQLKQFIHDEREIDKEIDARMSIDFMNELDSLRHGQPAAIAIHPGDLYRHKALPLLRLQVIDEYDYRGPLWSVRVFIGRAYACRFIVKSSTIIEHFTKTTEA
jgi:hypothetical protein